MDKPTLPPALAADPRFAVLCDLIREHYANLPIEQILLYLVETAPEVALPHLAEQFSLTDEPIWSAASSHASKRRLLKQAIELHRYKGTVWAVKQLVQSFGGSIALREWWQHNPPGEPHTFELVLTLTGQAGATPSASEIEAVIAAIHQVKPVRSHFTFTQGVQARAGMPMLAAARAVTYRRLSVTEH